MQFLEGTQDLEKAEIFSVLLNPSLPNVPFETVILIYNTVHDYSYYHNYKS